MTSASWPITSRTHSAATPRTTPRDGAPNQRLATAITKRHAAELDGQLARQLTAGVGQTLLNESEASSRSSATASAIHRQR